MSRHFYSYSKQKNQSPMTAATDNKHIQTFCIFIDSLFKGNQPVRCVRFG